MKCFFTLVLILIAATGFSQSFERATPIKVADNLGSLHPQIEITNDGQPAVIWTDNSNNDLYFAKYNGTNAFLPAIKLNPGTLEVQSFNWSGPDLYMEGDNIYVVFKENGFSTGHIYLVKSSDNGATWGDTVRVDQLGSGFGNFPDVAVQNDTIWVTFMDHDDAGGANPQYVVARSTDGGASFEPEVAAGILWGAEACDCCQPEIIVNNERVIVFFRNNDNDIRDVKAVVSLDRGGSFTDMYSVDDHNWFITGCPSTGPDARFMGNDKTLTTYKTFESGTGAVFINEYNLVTDMSDGLVEIEQNGSNAANYPQIDYKNGVIGIVWEDNSNSVDVFAKLSSTGVSGFSSQTAFNITDQSGVQNKPDIALTDDKIHVVYTDVSENDVYYTQLTSLSSVKESAKSFDVDVYPNPATDQLKITFDNPGNKTVSFKLHDLSGRIVSNQPLIQSNQIIMDVSEIPSGVYGYELKVDEKVVKGKLMIQ